MCIFINKNYVIDRHPFKSKSESFCLTLSKIYKLEEDTIKTIFDEYPVQLESINLKQIIRENYFLDYTHTTQEGYFRIAQFINLIYKE